MPAPRLLLPSPGRVQGRSPRVVLVSDPGAALDRAILESSAPVRGTVVVGVSPMTRSAARLCGDILQQLGKGRWTAPESRVGMPERFWAESWLRGWGVSRVVLHAADLLDDAILSDIAAVIADAGAEGWFTFASTGPMLHATGVLRGSPARLDGSELLALLAASPGPTRRVPRGHPAPLEADGLTSFHRVADFVAATSAIRREMSHLNADRRVRAVAELARSAQNGWSVHLLDEMRLRDPLTYNPLRLPADWDWACLHGIRDTAMPAAAVIAASGASILEMLALRARHVAPDGSFVAVAEDVLPIPLAARLFLRTRLAAVDLLGGDAPFLSDDWGKVIGPRQLRTTVCATFEEGGLAIPRLATPYRQDPDRRWLERHGLELTPTPMRGRAVLLFRRPGRSDCTHTYRTPDRHPWRQWRRGSEQSRTEEGAR